MAQAKKEAPTLGDRIDALHALREQKRELNKQLKDVDSEVKDLEAELLEAMHEQGLDQTRGSLATASISKSVVPQVEDWDKFHAFLIKNKMPWLLQRRVSADAYREVLERRKNRKIPGVSNFEKETLNLRKRS